MRAPCDPDVVVIECRLSATIRFGIIDGHLSLTWQTYPHPGFLEIATAAVWVEWLITPMTDIS